MKTIILPGFSPHNRDWAYEIKERTKTNGEMIVHEWRHWKTGGGISIKYELEKILEETGKGKFNIIAKSVGTRVAMAILKEVPLQIGKIILCGVPTTSPDMQSEAKEALKGFDVGKIICFQNTSDPFASYSQIKKFMKGVNPKIRIVEKPRHDHNYPYYEDFESFLES